MFNVICSCGTTKTVRLASMREGTTVSCGHVHIENCRRDLSQASVTHGLSKTPLYMVWLGMIQRCHNPKDKSFGRYGAKGISVCQEWRDSYEAFHEAVAPRPKGLTLDRINGKGNYEPGNVRWATYTEQARNTSRNVMVLVNGAPMTQPDAADLLGASYERLRKSLKCGGPYAKNLGVTYAG